MIALLTGGSGCGKSTYAERLFECLPFKNRYYIATMRVYDHESELRVERHRRQRADKGFTTVECPLDAASAGIPDGAVVLFEDFPNILANEMFDDSGDPERIFPAVVDLMKRCAHLIIVTNDVFSDDAAQYLPETREYIRRLAELNNRTAEMADYVAEVVYSIPVVLKGEAPCV